MQALPQLADADSRTMSAGAWSATGGLLQMLELAINEGCDARCARQSSSNRRVHRFAYSSALRVARASVSSCAPSMGVGFGRRISEAPSALAHDSPRRLVRSAAREDLIEPDARQAIPDHVERGRLF